MQYRAACWIYQKDDRKMSGCKKGRAPGRSFSLSIYLSIYLSLSISLPTLSHVKYCKVMVLQGACKM